MANARFLRLTAIIIAVLISGTPTLRAAEDNQSTTAAADAKTAVKDAAHAVGHTTRVVTRAVGHGTRDAAKAIGHGTRKVAHGVGKAATDAWQGLTGKSE